MVPWNAMSSFLYEHELNALLCVFVGMRLSFLHRPASITQAPEAPGRAAWEGPVDRGVGQHDLHCENRQDCRKNDPNLRPKWITTLNP